MSYTSSRPQEPPIQIENLQEFYSAILEYYDELFPLNDSVVNFFTNLQHEQQADSLVQPVPLCRYLGIGCATGTLENRLSTYGLDITGIDKNPDMIETAKRRMKRGYSSLRFFEMSAIDIKRFLKKGSFHIISCINNTLPYVADETLLRKFFHDSRELLVPSGKLIIQTVNYDLMEKNKTFRLPKCNSVRVTLERSYIPAEGGMVILDSALELGNGRKIILQKTTRLLPVTADRLRSFAKEAGFLNCEQFGDFASSPWTEESAGTVLVFS